MFSLPNRRAALAVVALLCPLQAHADLAQCARIEDNTARLACYDALAHREASATAHAPLHAIAPNRPSSAAPTQKPTWLQEQWDLTPALKRGVFRLEPYRPVYALIHATDSRNERPMSPTRPFDPSLAIGLDSVEAKLQLSLKTKVAQDLFGTQDDLWFGYTQRSYWQAANHRNSSPFRETDYEPELIYIHPVDFHVGDLTGRYLGLSLTHQSNGQGRALSRSWNRLIGDLAVESGDWAFHVRPWIRIYTTRGNQNDNPDIENYAGRGEIVAVRREHGQVLTLKVRHSLRGGSASHGSASLDWAYPLEGSLNFHLQLFSGYGENLLDYNHRQTTVGVGISFFD